jgi:hypothetical protein
MLHDHELVHKITNGAHNLQAEVESKLGACMSVVCMQLVHCSRSAHVVERLQLGNVRAAPLSKGRMPIAEVHSKERSPLHHQPRSLRPWALHSRPSQKSDEVHIHYCGHLSRTPPATSNSMLLSCPNYPASLSPYIESFPHQLQKVYYDPNQFLHLVAYPSFQMSVRMTLVL